MSATDPTHRYADDEARWQAVLSRDAGADGVFYYAVRSTGIFCRPTCPARRPRRSVVTFFDIAEAAEQAGFRPCRRCHPGDVSVQQHAVAHVQRMLDTAGRIPSLSDLGRAVGFSPYHLQRLFKRATGLTPRGYAASRRVERLKGELRAGASVTTAMSRAGYGSSRSLYDTDRTEVAMKPSTYRKGGQGERIAYAVTDSPLGRMLIAATDRGACAIKFGDDAELVTDLRAQFPRAILIQDTRAVETHVHAVLDHLSRGPARLDMPLDIHATVFQQRVWDALCEIPYGETRSYAEVAGMIGAPGSARAVARACATNPVALAIPCHRVVGSSGALTGYRWGIDLKRILIDGERAALQHRHSDPKHSLQ